MARLLAAAAFVLSAACAATPPARFSSPEAAAQYHVLVGELAAQRRQPALAAREFLQALELLPDPELAERATALALGAEDDALALKIARLWLELAPASLEAREVIARLSLRRGLFAEAEAQALQIVQGHAGGEEDGLRYVALLLSQEPQHGEAALRILQALRDRWPDLPGAHYALGLAALRFDRLDMAEQAAREALRLNAGARDASLLLTGILVKRGDLAGADRILEDVIRGQPASEHELRLGYIKLLLDAEQHVHARSQLEAILKRDPANSDAHFALGLLWLEQQQPQQAEPHFKAALKTGTRKKEAAYYLGRIAELESRDQEALGWYEQVTSGTQAIDATVRKALILGRGGKVTEARTLLQQLRRQYPPLSTRFYLAEGELLLDARRDEEALALYNQALTEEPGEIDLYYARSLVYERLKRLSDAERDLRHILQEKPDDARALNALGYMLTVHTDRLTEARDLIARALALEPDDAAILDSMGWLHFRMGNLKDARALLQKAFERLKDPEIAAHLGEVLWAMGEKEHARQVWQKGLSVDPDHEVLRQTVERHLQ